MGIGIASEVRCDRQFHAAVEELRGSGCARIDVEIEDLGRDPERCAGIRHIDDA